jgi:hypothetical protein
MRDAFAFRALRFAPFPFQVLKIQPSRSHTQQCDVVFSFQKQAAFLSVTRPDHAPRRRFVSARRLHLDCDDAPTSRAGRGRQSMSSQFAPGFDSI